MPLPGRGASDLPVQQRGEQQADPQVLVVSLSRLGAAGQCTTSDCRRIGRREREAVLYRMQRRPDRVLQATRLRRQTIEHVFDTFMASMESAHFLNRTPPRVSLEVRVACSSAA
jgi:hypothetical protein